PASGTLRCGPHGRSATKSENKGSRSSGSGRSRRRDARPKRGESPYGGVLGDRHSPYGRRSSNRGYPSPAEPSSSQYHFTRRAPVSASLRRSSASTDGSRTIRRTSSGRP